MSLDSYPDINCCTVSSRTAECQAAELVLQLQQQLHEKDLKLTDVQLEALSSAHQLEQLKDTLNQMKVGAAGRSSSHVEIKAPRYIF